MDTWSIRKNEPKTKPIEPKTNPILANKTPERTQYKANSNPIYPVEASCKAGTNPIITISNSQNYPISHQRIMNNEQRTYNKQTKFHIILAYF
jgi:hypothetical protein